MAFPTTSMGSLVPGERIARDIEFFDDFTYIDAWTPGLTAPSGTWVRNNTGALSLRIVQGSVLQLALGVSDNDKEEWIQTLSPNAPGGELTTGAFSVKPGTDTYFAARIRFPTATDITTTDWYAGLSTWTTTPLALTANFMGFSSSTGTAIENSGTDKIYGTMAKSGTKTFIDSGKVVTANQFIDLAVHVIGGTRINFYCRGQLVGSRNSGMPTANAPMACAFGAKVNSTVGAKIFQIDYIFAAQTRETEP